MQLRSIKIIWLVFGKKVFGIFVKIILKPSMPINASLIWSELMF